MSKVALRAQTYLEQNLGPGLQHLALKSDDIFATLAEMRRRSEAGGFDFMPPASDSYYECAWPAIVLLYSCTLLLTREGNALCF
jgi:4-hydroxyphenylpyruvate dioxygenase-like putative hemolysin